MSERTVAFRVLFDLHRAVAPEGAYRLRVTAHLRVLYSREERLAIVNTSASVSDDDDYDWLPTSAAFLWEDMTEESVVLMIHDQWKHWSEIVKNAIPAGFLAPAPDAGPAS